ncbi:TPA: response regulator [bacterium]|jgi:CheY-like chemotaxis protein|nr:response regulator [bacterium]
MPNKILVVEDNDKNRKLVRIILQSKGYELMEATTAEEAINQLKENIPDLILLDIQLPQMDGLELTKKIRDQKETKDIPIIALTAYAMKGDKERILEAGCDDYISKPIDTRQLPIKIAEIISKPKINK